MTVTSLLTTSLSRAASLSDAAYDAVIVISHCASAIAGTAATQPLSAAVEKYLQLNKSAANSAHVIPVDESILPSGRLIYSGTGPVSRDYDDVRRFGYAARDAMKLALSAGVQSPLLVTLPHSRYPQAELVAALGALQSAHMPLNVREAEPNRQTLKQLGLLPVSSDGGKRLLELVAALDQAFTVTRDVGDQGPERMAPPRVSEYVQGAFAGSDSVRVSVIEDQAEIKREFPLISAVNRGCDQVPRHHARYIRLEYVGEGPTEQTIYLVGKGVTLDTGGIDLKIGGSMFGMCRDKYGAAVVAGFFKVLEQLKPKGIKVVGQMSAVRNSIGAEAYSTDEVLTSRSGKRIHIYNTDAEGRLILLDQLTKAREEAVDAVNPHVLTVATLTGHEVIAYGYYASMLDNGPARASGLSKRIQDAGDEYGQPVEITRLHHEDFVFHAADCKQADLRQGNTRPSTQTMRGHMGPAAFLTMGSRLDEHGTDSNKPIPFTHIDMGAAQGEHPDTSYPNPLVALVAAMILPRV